MMWGKNRVRNAVAAGAVTKIKTLKEIHSNRFESIYCDCVERDTQEMYTKTEKKPQMEIMCISFRVECSKDVYKCMHVLAMELIIAFCYKSHHSSAMRKPEESGDNCVACRMQLNCNDNRTQQDSRLNWVVYAFNEVFNFGAKSGRVEMCINRFAVVSKSIQFLFSINWTRKMNAQTPHEMSHEIKGDKLSGTQIKKRLGVNIMNVMSRAERRKKYK